MSGVRASVSAGLRVVPRAAWLCALVAVINAVAWALITPPIQVPDEQAHIYYVQQLAETGQVPKPTGASEVSPQTQALQNAGHLYDINTGFFGRPDWTASQARADERAIREGSPEGGGGDVGVGSYPPLYYAILAAPYSLTGAAGGSLLDQLTAMRVVSALFAACTVLFVFLFLRELLPRAPWAWRAGALMCALQPMFGFVSGGVNPDSLLAAWCAALFYALARAFRRGLTVGTGVALGGLMAAATLTKLSAVGLGPGLLVALALLLWRTRPEERPEALRGVAGAALAFGGPMAVYLVLNTAVWGRPLLPGAGQSVGGNAVAAGAALTLKGYLTYTWQLVFPKLSFMYDWHAGFLPREIWLKGWVGRFGWGGVVFDPHVYRTALGVLYVLLGAAAFSLIRFRASVRRRLPEITAYVALAAGLMLFYGYVGYSYFVGTGMIFEQARYLLPLIALYGALVGVAVAGLGRRVGPPAGLLLVVLALAHNVAAVMLTVGRYYA